MDYDPARDPGQKYREEMRHQREKIGGLRSAARVLAKACERGDRAMMWALPGGNNNLGARLSRPADGATVPILSMGSAWFTELEQALKSKIPELHGGPFMQRFTIGNLHFEKPLQARRPIEVASMLAFELAFYLRMFTAGRSGDLVQMAQTPPTDGKPCMPVVAAFCNAALGTQLNAKQLADRLRKLPIGTGLINWPKAE